MARATVRKLDLFGARPSTSSPPMCGNGPSALIYPHASNLEAVAYARDFSNPRLNPQFLYPCAACAAFGSPRVFASKTISRSAVTAAAGFLVGPAWGAATALAARDRGLPKPAGIVTLSLWGDLTCSGETMTIRSARLRMHAR